LGIGTTILDKEIIHNFLLIHLLINIEFITLLNLIREIKKKTTLETF